MKSISYFLLFNVCMCNPLYLPAQVVADKFGTVKTEQLSMTSYGTYNEAEAVILYDFGSTYFEITDDGPRTIFERTTKIKILSKAGLDYASVEVPYYVDVNEMEKVYDISGYTFTLEDGEIKTSMLNSKATFNEKISEHWMTKKFAMPDIKVGSVIEYRYKVQSPYYFNFHDWDFQSRIPTVYSEYTVKMIPFYEYCYILQGARKFDVYTNNAGISKRSYAGTEFADNIFTFGMKNVPAFRDEAYITSINDYLMKMDFQLAVVHYPNGGKSDVLTTWPLLIHEMLKHSDFGLFMKAASRAADEIITANIPESITDLEKTELITRYVKQNFNWNGYTTKFAEQSVKELLKARTGNSAEINLFLCSMLNTAGIKAYPILLSTRDHGKIAIEYPFQQFINYVIVLVEQGDQKYLLDATVPLSPFGMLPARCINDKGLIIDNERNEWISLSDHFQSVMSDSIYIALNETLDSANIDFSLVANGHKALDYRELYLFDKEAFKKQIISTDMTIRKDMIVAHESDTEVPLEIQYSVNMPVETIGDKILISPFPGLTLKENPLKVGYRNYPVDLIYPETNIFKTVIEIPKGYKFADQHLNASIDNALVNISYATEFNTDKLVVNGSYTFKKAVYLQNEYFDLKSYFTNIVKTFNSKMILVKNYE